MPLLQGLRILPSNAVILTSHCMWPVRCCRTDSGTGQSLQVAATAALSTSHLQTCTFTASSDANAAMLTFSPKLAQGQAVYNSLLSESSRCRKASSTDQSLHVAATAAMSSSHLQA